MRLAIEHRFGEMVCYHPPDIESVPIIEAVNQLSCVDINSSAVQAARALGISFGDAACDEAPFHFDGREERTEELAGEPQMDCSVEQVEEFTHDEQMLVQQV